MIQNLSVKAPVHLLRLRVDSEGGAEDGAVVDAAPGAAFIGVSVTLRLLIMMLRCHNVSIHSLSTRVQAVAPLGDDPIRCPHGFTRLSLKPLTLS